MRRVVVITLVAVVAFGVVSATPNFSSCSQVKAIPGNANGATDSQCSACANGAQAWYPCDTDGLCYCSANGGTVPPQYRLPFFGCSKAIAVVGNPNNVKDSDCLQCSGGTYRYYPCDQPGTLCTCAPGYGSVVTTPSPPTTATPPTAAPPKTPVPVSTPQPPPPPPTPAPTPSSLTDAPPTAPPPGVTPQQYVNSLSDLQQPYAPFCDSLSSSGATAARCGQSYDQALCNSMLFYMAQSGGNVARGLDWRGTCFMNDVWNGRNLTLGWFDAGDYVKFGLPMAYSATALSWGALLWPGGYSTPMTQSALLYNLRVAGFYFYNAWNPTTQTLVAQIGDGTADHSTWFPCKVRTTETRIMQTISPSCPGTEVAADTASALAAIALVLKKYEGTGSSTLQNQFATAALQLWNFANGAKGTYTSCVPGAKSFYDSWSGYNDELAFAGTWMHELAQNGLIAASSTYLSTAQTYYAAPGNLDWDNKMLGASLRLYALTGGATYKSDILGRVAVYTTSGPRTAGGLISGINTWGSLREAANAAFVARYAADLGLDSGNAALLLAKRQLDYMLGKNPAGRSYMVGFGANSPINAHHRSAHDSPTGSISNPTNDRHTIYGALVGGPPSSDTDYYDDRTNYQTNEVATDYNALFTGLIASFAGSWTAPSGVDASTTCSATSKGAPPAPPGPALAPGAFTITSVTLQSWYLQVKIKPQSGVQSVTILYNDGNGQCSGTGPQWPDNSDGSAQWTCSVSGTPVGTGAISVKVTTASGSLTKIIKEGGVALALQVSQSVAEFSSPDFVQTVAQATNVTDVSRISVTGLTAVDSKNSLVNFTIDPLPFPAYTVKGEAFISNDGGIATNTFGSAQTTTSVYSAFQIGADGQPNSTSSVMQILETNAGVVQGTIIIINNPTYIYYAAPPPDGSFATSPVGAALGGACATLIFFGGLFGGYKYAKRNKGKKPPQTVIVVVGQEGLQRALMNNEMSAVPAKTLETGGEIA